MKKKSKNVLLATSVSPEKDGTLFAVFIVSIAKLYNHGHGTNHR